MQQNEMQQGQQDAVKREKVNNDKCSAKASRDSSRSNNNKEQQQQKQQQQQP